MKLILISLSALAMTLLPSCTDTEASATTDERPPENGAQFKKGEGLSLTDEMAKSIDLQTADVTERKIASRVQFKLMPVPGTNEATGWLNASQVEKIQPGATVQISGQPGITARIKSIEKDKTSALSESEVVVVTENPLKGGSEVEAAVVLPETEEAASIPRSALFSTAEGSFAYAKNGNFFVRTPVTTGAMDEDHVEIKDGLYSGDVVVTKAVKSLWMAELQVLRGGKACSCGH
jgi:hypothetical protein